MSVGLSSKFYIIWLRLAFLFQHALVGYEIVTANEARCAELASSWNDY